MYKDKFEIFIRLHDDEHNRPCLVSRSYISRIISKNKTRTIFFEDESINIDVHESIDKILELCSEPVSKDFIIVHDYDSNAKVLIDVSSIIYAYTDVSDGTTGIMQEGFNDYFFIKESVDKIYNMLTETNIEKDSNNI